MNKELKPLEALSIMHFNCREYDNLDKHYDIIEKALKEGEKAKKIAEHYGELVFDLIEELNIEFELSTDGYRDEDGTIDIDYYVSFNGDRKKVWITKEQYDLLRKWEEN